MMLIITGTPGTGKTSVTKRLRELIKAEFISINSLLEDYDLNLGTDEVRGYKIVDTEKMIPIIDEIKEKSSYDIIIFEGHLAQDYPKADKVLVLRCNPEILRKRLDARNWRKQKVDENISAEILGVCTSESYETYGEKVQEIDSSKLDVDELALQIIKIINDEVKYPLGEIDYLADYFDLL